MRCKKVVEMSGERYVPQAVDHEIFSPGGPPMLGEAPWKLAKSFFKECLTFHDIAKFDDSRR